jgi:heptosyltransferase-2
LRNSRRKKHILALFPQKNPQKKFMPFSVLLIRLSSLGDVLLASPLVRELRRAYSAAGEELRLDVCTGERESEIYRHNPHCDAVYAYNRSWSRAELEAWKQDILSKLASGAEKGKTGSADKYDLVLDLQRNARSRRIRAGLGKRALLVSKPRLRTLALLALGAQARSFVGAAPHVVERYRQAANGAAIKSAGLENAIIESEELDDGEGLEFWLREERFCAAYPPLARIPSAQSLCAPKNLLCIGVAPGAKHATKRWLPEYFAEAAALAAERAGRLRARDVAFVVLGGADEAELCARVRDMALNRGISPDSVSLCVGNSLANAARALDRCDALLCNDSGAMHLATARRTPVVAVFGSTTPELGFAPYRAPSAIAEISLPCRPCTHLGRERCPRGHFKCMRLLQPASVAEALCSLLFSSP